MSGSAAARVPIGAAAEIAEPKMIETAEAMNGLQRLLMCAVAVSMPPPSKRPQTAQSRPANRPPTAFEGRPRRSLRDASSVSRPPCSGVT
jgi:hypothetical protein